MSNQHQQIDSTGMGNLAFDEDDDLLLDNDPGITTVNSERDLAEKPSKDRARLESIEEE